MRIIRSSGLRAVVRVKRRGIVTLAIPESLPSREVVELASLVLSTSEYEEFRDTVEPAADGDLWAGRGLAHLEKPVG